MIAAAEAIPNNLKAEELYLRSVAIINCLKSHGVNVVSYSCDGTEVEQSVQNLLISRATNWATHVLPDPDDRKGTKSGFQCTTSPQLCQFRVQNTPPKLPGMGPLEALVCWSLGTSYRYTSTTGIWHSAPLLVAHFFAETLKRWIGRMTTLQRGCSRQRRCIFSSNTSPAASEQSSTCVSWVKLSTHIKAEQFPTLNTSRCSFDAGTSFGCESASLMPPGMQNQDIMSPERQVMFSTSL